MLLAQNCKYTAWCVILKGGQINIYYNLLNILLSTKGPLT